MVMDMTVQRMETKKRETLGEKPRARKKKMIRRKKMLIELRE